MASGGFVVAFYIRRAKLRGERLLCPLNSDCDAVVRSRYSTLKGVPLENLGLLYYAGLIIFYGLGIFFPALPRWAPAGIFVSLTSLAGALFSIYLIRVQLVKLKEWCVWCLLSSLISILIFLATLGLWLA